MPITPDDLTQEQIDRLFPLRRAPIKAATCRRMDHNYKSSHTK
jgi:hypothetical protein